MQPIYVNPFISAAIKIIKKTTGVEIYKKNINIRKGKNSLGGVGIILGLEGDINGKVAYEFSRGMTMQLSSKMIKKSHIPFNNKEDFTKLLRSATAELGNLISGRAITYLHQNGYNCRITPPKIYIGQGVPLIPFDVMVFVIELETQYGDFIINLALQTKEEKEKAEKKTNPIPASVT